MSEEIKLNIYQRISAVQHKIQGVGKDADVGTGGGRSYKGVTHDAVLGMIREACLLSGIIVSPSQVSKGLSVPGKTKAGGDKIRFEAVYDVSFINIDDPADRHTVSVEAHADDSGDKAPGKTISYATKTAELKVFMLKTGENDEERIDNGEDNSAYYQQQQRPPEPVRLPADQEKCRTRIKVALSNDVATVEDLEEVMKNEKYLIDKMPTDTKNAIYTNFAKRGVTVDF